MSSSNVVRLAVLAGASFIVHPLFAQVRDWTNSSGGNWTVTTNWLNNSVPDTAAEEARFGMLSLPYSVMLDSNLTIGALTLNAGSDSSVSIPPTRSLTISGGSIFNTGTIYLGANNATSLAALRLPAADTVINGNGTIVLQGYTDNVRARIFADDTANSGFVLFPNQRIQGAGQIFATNMFNQGVIRAEFLGRLEVINSWTDISNALVNTGTMRAINGATLVMHGIIDNNNVGVISTDDTGIFRLQNTGGMLGTVMSGLIDTSAGGMAQYATSTKLLDGVELRGNHTAEGTLTLGDGTINNGTLRMLSVQSTIPLLRIVESGAGFSTVNGTGTISFEHTGLYGVDFETPNSTSILRFPNQDILGGADFRCNVRFGAQVSPGLAAPNRIGRFLFDRDCRLNSTSVTTLDVQGATPNLRDEFNASGNSPALIIDSGATLRIRLGNGYVPSHGDIMTLINMDGFPITGTFSTLELINAPANLSAELIYNGVGVRVQWSVGLQCDSIDFNNDTSLFDPQDIEAFLSVYSEGPCIPANATCGDIDFNNDASLFDPCDINSFLLLYSEGPCTLCGV